MGKLLLLLSTLLVVFVLLLPTFLILLIEVAKFGVDSGDYTVKIIDCQTGKCLKVLSVHRRTTWLVRFHPLCPDILASGSLDHEVRLWNANTSECIGSRDFRFTFIVLHSHSQTLYVATITHPPIIYVARCNTLFMSTKTESIVAQLKSSGLFQTKGLIGGKWIDAYDGRTIEVNNPSSGDVTTSVACMGERETKDAISSVYEAFRRMDLQVSPHHY
ncbi:hypothetical protein L6452_11152 [Arctium lappa]|uniref:Uncharacterized protein n=1 Tax=Arctium lappa TaxID=4217 RepID=A0ACB9DPI7_ARCLA|nr:hypothetical protein L6452_11152 [Arctium lappa]